jgi:hypothetical protein
MARVEQSTRVLPCIPLPKRPCPTLWLARGSVLRGFGACGQGSNAQNASKGHWEAGRQGTDNKA